MLRYGSDSLMGGIGKRWGGEMRHSGEMIDVIKGR